MTLPEMHGVKLQKNCISFKTTYMYTNVYMYTNICIQMHMYTNVYKMYANVDMADLLFISSGKELKS